MLKKSTFLFYGFLFPVVKTASLWRHILTVSQQRAFNMREEKYFGIKVMQMLNDLVYHKALITILSVNAAEWSLDLPACLKTC